MLTPSPLPPQANPAPAPPPPTPDEAALFRGLTRRWRRGRHLGLLHLLLSPVLFFLAGLAIKRFGPASWLVSGEPVWYYLGAAALWLIIFIAILLRDRHYTCPRCGSRVRPFGGTSMPSYRPHPCPKCGLSAPPPPY